MTEANKKDALKDEDNNGIADVDEVDATRCVSPFPCFQPASIIDAYMYNRSIELTCHVIPTPPHTHSYFLRKVNLVLVSVNPETLSEAMK